MSDKLRKNLLYVALMVFLLTVLAGGGWITAKSLSSSRWTIAWEDGVYWLQTPQGKLFYSKGVNKFDGGKESKKSRRNDAFFWGNYFQNLNEWRQSAQGKLIRWGFNTRGAWSDSSPELSLPLMVELDLGRHAKVNWFDPFDPSMEQKTLQWAKKLTAPYRNDPYLIGYFTDNEIGWWNAPLVRWYLKADWENHTKRVLWQLLYDHYHGDWERLLKDWVPQSGSQSFEDLKRADVELKLRPGGEGIHLINQFTYLCAGRYYQLVNKALRLAHPGALILGDRLPLYYNQDAVLAMKDQVDVISTNYNVDVPDGWVAPYYFKGLQQLTGKPVLVTEFFFAAHENRSGNLNSGHLMTVDTQAQRARGVANAIRNFARFPNVVGAHWFQYYDEPRGGRADGENYNMGLVDHAELPYKEVTGVFRQINPQLNNIHRKSNDFKVIATSSETRTAMPLHEKKRTISVTDQSLLDWNKADTLLDGFRTAKPYVPFADVHMAWAPEGIYLTSIASNYVDLQMLDYKEKFPLSETFQLHFLIKGGDGKLHHYAVHLSPVRGQRFPDRLEVQPQLYRYEAGKPVEQLPVQGHLQKLNKPLPHIAFEAFFPAEWLGFERLQVGSKLQMNILVRSYYRELTMTWTNTDSLDNNDRSDTLRSVILVGNEQRTALR